MFQTYMQPVIQAMRQPSEALSLSGSLSPIRLLNRVRHLNSQQMTAAAVVTAELLGFFTVGEIIGRFKLVGYRGETDTHH